jgi:hypothetical protein
MDIVFYFLLGLGFLTLILVVPFIASMLQGKKIKLEGDDDNVNPKFRSELDKYLRIYDMKEDLVFFLCLPFISDFVVVGSD